MQDLADKVNIDRLTEDTLKLVNIESVTGNTVEMADRYGQMLKQVGCTVERHEFIPNNPTLIAKYGEGKGKKLIFNGHMDVIPLEHEPPFLKDGKLYGRGSCDMKGSLAAILEVLRVIEETKTQVDGEIIIIANSLHESPGGRGEDLSALVQQSVIGADAAVVMEGATYDCTIAQLGSATFKITVEREGEPSHQLYTKEGTPHPISIAAEIVTALDERNNELKKEIIEDIGHASYFIGSIKSGEFYNQMPKRAFLEGVRRYGPSQSFSQIEGEMKHLLGEIAKQNQVQIHLELEKIRDGYRVNQDTEIVKVLSKAVRKVRGIDPPLVGKKLVTDAGIFANELKVPTVCSGPNQERAHSEIEYVEVNELAQAAKVYLEIIGEFVGLKREQHL